MERLTRLLTVALLLLAYAPLPRPSQALAGKMACCTPQACHHAGKGCVSGGGCEMAGPATGDAATSADAGAAPRHPSLLAGHCGGRTPAVTPVAFDPSVTPTASTLSGPAIGGLAHATAIPDHPILQAEPSVPPPRA